MTATPRTASYDPTLNRGAAAPAAAPRSGLALLAGHTRHERAFFWGTMIAVTAMFALLQNPYWVPAGDSEVYVSIARSVVKGEGYVFNGQPVAMVPPGWPAALALMMTITPYFLPLKLLTMGCMLGSLAIAYWICRRFVSPGWSSFVILATAVLSHVYQATFWLISEPLFCLVTSWSLLVAMHVKERAAIERGLDGWWRIALLAVLAAAAVLVRWAGVLGVLPIAAILLHGYSLREILASMGGLARSLWRRISTRGRSTWGFLATPLSRMWMTMLLAGLAASAAFFILRSSQRGWEASEGAALTASSGGEEAVGGGALMLTERLVAQQYSIISSTISGATYSGRFSGWGRWFSWLYWQPFRAGMGDPTVDLLAQLLGWIIIALLLFTAGFGAARRDWMWLALVTYCFMLAFNWPNVNARYYVPIVFLLTIGLLHAGNILRSFGNRLWRGCVTAALWMFLGSMLLVNAGLWAVDVKVARSEDFYAAYEAGLNQTIISANRYLVQQPDLRDAEVAVTPSYNNMGRRRPSQFALRVTAMLTGKAIINVPRKRQYPPSPRLARWCQLYGIRYYLHQNPISPWRVWHYRVPNWWQERLQGYPVENIEAGWKLYRVVPTIPAVPGVVNETSPYMVPIDTPPSRHWPTRVPGL